MKDPIYCLALDYSQKLVKNPCDGTRNSQKWKIIKKADQEYKLYHKGTGLYLEVPKSTQSNPEAIVNSGKVTKQQIFNLPYDKNHNYYRISDKDFGQCINVSSNENGKFTFQKQKCTPDNKLQQFKIIPSSNISGLMTSINPQLPYWQHIKLMMNKAYCLDVHENMLVQNPCIYYKKSQMWKIEKKINNDFKIKNRKTEKYLEVPDGSKNKIQLEVKTNKNTVFQRFLISPNENKRIFEIKNKSSERCLDVPFGKLGKDFKIWQFKCNKTYPQRFKFVPSLFLRSNK
jgi:hypothetical protein